jgi:hypothetical protein
LRPILANSVQATALKNLIILDKSTIAIGVATVFFTFFLEKEFSSQVKKGSGKGDINQYFLHP